MDKPIVTANYSFMDNIFELAKAVLEEIGVDMTDPKNIDKCEDCAIFCADHIAYEFGFEWDWEENDEPDNIDDDCGFDPYMGCFSDDC